MVFSCLFVCLFAGGRETIFSYYFDENIRYFVVFFDKESAYYFWEMIGFCKLLSFVYSS